MQNMYATAKICAGKDAKEKIPPELPECQNALRKSSRKGYKTTSLVDPTASSRIGERYMREGVPYTQ
jgi:hypothetical protein